MSWFRRSPHGRHTGRSDTSARSTFPEATAATPVAEPAVRGLVRLAFRDGSAVALDPHDPRAAPFRAIADLLAARRPSDPG
jgi:hypothetical protein